MFVCVCVCLCVEADLEEARQPDSHTVIIQSDNESATERKEEEEAENVVNLTVAVRTF